MFIKIERPPSSLQYITVLSAHLEPRLYVCVCMCNEACYNCTNTGNANCVSDQLLIGPKVILDYVQLTVHRARSAEIQSGNLTAKQAAMRQTR